MVGRRWCCSCAVVGVAGVVAAPAAGSVQLSSVVFFFALAICGPFIYLLSGRKNGNGLCHLCNLPLSFTPSVFFSI